MLKFQARPTLREAFERLSESSEDMGKWVSDYRVAAENLFQAFTHYLESQAADESTGIREAIARGAPELEDQGTLSQQALPHLPIASRPDCILLGMRRPAYVADALSAGEPIDPASALRAIEEVQREMDTES